jgi:hypothetical protein
MRSDTAEAEGFVKMLQDQMEQVRDADMMREAVLCLMRLLGTRSAAYRETNLLPSGNRPGLLIVV